MKKSRKRKILRIFLISFILLAGSFLARPERALAAAEVECPAPTVEQGNHCILKKDVVLKAPIELASNTKLDCKGYKILPSQGGQPDDPATKAFDPVFS